MGHVEGKELTPSEPGISVPKYKWIETNSCTFKMLSVTNAWTCHTLFIIHVLYNYQCSISMLYLNVSSFFSI